MLDLSNIKTIKDLLERNGFSFSKRLGQNFLINPSVCPRMAEMGNAREGVGVLEIGAGIGVLTAELARRAEKVVCVEIDSALFPILSETLQEFDNIKLIHGDILKVDVKKLLEEEFPGLETAVCANLPYYITSPILMKLLEEKLPLKSITVMVQKEAAQRICAKPGTREVGAISIAVRYYGEPKVLFPVSRGSFLPAPNVDSCVIRIDLFDQPPVQVKSEQQFFSVVKAAFSQRRKMLVNCLGGSFPLTKEELYQVLDTCGISRTARAEELSMEQFALLSDTLPSKNN